MNIKIKTNVPITFYDTDSTSETDIIIGELKEKYESNKNDIIKVSFEYRSEIKGTIIPSEPYFLALTELEQLHDQVKSGLPSTNTDGVVPFLNALMVEAFKIKMVQKFISNKADLTTEHIEVFTPEI